MTTRLLDDFSPTSPEEWRALVEKDLKGADFERALSYRAAGGFRAEPLYHAADPDASGFPGTAPHTRGFRPPEVGAAAGPWSPAQVVDHPDPAEANRRLLHGLSLGVRRAWLRLASDEEDGGVKDGGVRIESRADLERLLHDVEVSFIELGVDSDAPGADLDLLFEWAEHRGVDPKDLRGSVGFDPLARRARYGLPIVDAPWKEAWKASDRCLDQAPGLRALRIDTTPYHDAGASAVEELAAGLSAGVEVLRRADAAGRSPAATAPQIETLHAVSSELFLEIAKLRAWRKLWARVLTESGAEDAVAAQTIHLLPSGLASTIVDPWVNLLRSTSQVFIGALAGVDSVVAEPFDGHGGGDLGRRAAINSHHVLAEESYLARVADPAGGSWAIEALTERLAEDAWELFRELERRGGLGTKDAYGELRRRIAETVDERRRDLHRRKDVVVGVSMYPNLEETRPDGIEATPELELEGPLALDPFRKAAGFEELRLEVDAAAESAERPRVALVQLGDPADARARAQFTSDFVAVAGFEPRLTDPTADPAEAAERFTASGARAAVLCSTDERYADLAGPAARALKDAGARSVYLAGRPGEHEDEWRQAGIDGFVFLGCDVLDTLQRLWSELRGEESR